MLIVDGRQDTRDEGRSPFELLQRLSKCITSNFNPQAKEMALLETTRYITVRVKMFNLNTLGVQVYRRMKSCERKG